MPATARRAWIRKAIPESVAASYSQHSLPANFQPVLSTFMTRADGGLRLRRLPLQVGDRT